MSVEPRRGTHRAENFSDAFFAIVITLLVLDLRLPDAESFETVNGLWRDLRSLWPVAAAHVISFVNIYILWVSHHELMRLAAKTDTAFLYLNGALLFGIGLMPFSTGILAANWLSGDAKVAAGFYTGALLWVALFLNLLWRHLARDPARLDPDVTARDRARISRTYAVTLALYAAAFALAWVAPAWAVGMTIGLAVFFAVADRLSGFASEDVAVED